VAAVTPEPTIAAGIALPQPVRGRQLITALRQSRGAAVIVTESAIEQGKQQLGRAGFCVEPTAAVVWKGLENYLGECDLGKDAIAVAVLSGHGLKAL
jgi:threonine synthase